MIILSASNQRRKAESERRRQVKKESALERTKETRRRNKALAGYQKYRLAMPAIDGVPGIWNPKEQATIVLNDRMFYL